MPAFKLEIKDRKVHGRDWLWASVKRLFQTLPDGEYLWPHPEKPKRKRSDQQNRYYWGVVIKLISAHTGYEPEEMHQIMAEKYLSYEKNGRTFTRSTTKLKTMEFEDYMEQCRRFAAIDIQVYIPLPNEPGNYFYDMPKKAA